MPLTAQGAMRCRVKALNFVSWSRRTQGGLTGCATAAVSSLFFFVFVYHLDLLVERPFSLIGLKRKRKANKGEISEVNLPEGQDNQVDALRDLKKSAVPVLEAALAINKAFSEEYEDVSCPGKRCPCFILFLLGYQQVKEGVKALRQMRDLAALLATNSSAAPQAPVPRPRPAQQDDVSDEEGDDVDPASCPEGDIVLLRPPLKKKDTRLVVPVVEKTYLYVVLDPNPSKVCTD